MVGKPTRFRFYAEFSAPGFHDTESFWATDAEDALQQAELWACEPWKDFPRRPAVRLSPDWDAARLPDRTVLSRSEFERLFPDDAPAAGDAKAA